VPYTEILTDLHNGEKSLLPPPKSKIQVTKKQSKMKSEDETVKAKEEVKKESIVNPQSIVHSNQFQKNIIIDNPYKVIHYAREELCKTMSGMALYKIVIGRDAKSVRKNQIVLITSRVHSGETPGSEVFKGIYDFIISDT
jgi:hypothetical protein